MSLPLQTFQQLPCVPAIPQRSIQSLLPRLYLQKIQNFFYHYGNVHPGRRTALTDHLLYRVCISLGIQFLILLFIPARMRPLIPRPPPVGLVSLPLSFVVHSFRRSSSRLFDIILFEKPPLVKFRQSADRVRNH